MTSQLLNHVYRRYLLFLCQLYLSFLTVTFIFPLKTISFSFHVYDAKYNFSANKHSIFAQNSFYADIEKAFEKHPNVVIAVSEGVRFADGRYVGEGTQSGATDAFGHKYLQGTGKALETLVKDHFGCKVRSVELNLPQRCAAHILSANDINESFAAGRAAAMNSPTASGCMICYERSDAPYSITYRAKDVSEIANKIRKVPAEFINAEGNNVTDACLNYLLPLIQGEYPIVYTNGLPKHFTVKK